MAAIPVTQDNFTHLKRAVWEILPKIKSSHLTEALAQAVGCRTQAALLVDLQQSDATDPKFTLLDGEAFAARLKAFGYQMQADECFDLFETLATDGQSFLIRTVTAETFDIHYDTPRKQGWRNMMVAAINAGIEQKLFSIRPGDNRWQRDGAMFEFIAGNGIPCLGQVRDGGFDELAIDVVFWRSKESRDWIGAINAGFRAGDALASGWLERKKGAWLQSNSPDLHCRKHRLNEVAALPIKPKGFGDRGRFFL